MSRAINGGQHTSSDKAKAILDGAMQEFLTHGYTAASMDRLAIAAKVSKPTLYSYFQNKAGLFTALIEQIAQEKLQFALKSQDFLTSQGETSMDLKQIAIYLIDTITSDPQLLAFVRLVIGESGRFPELAESFILSIDKPIIQLLAQQLATNFTLPDTEAGARVIFGSIVYSVIVQEMLCGKDVLPMARDRLIDTLMYLFSSHSEHSNAPLENHLHS
jgi:TetR/AcrR family transcriptional regulator, regulator of autoinduction and epiphytic fitness